MEVLDAMKIGFFEVKPGERSLSALLSFMAFFGAVLFGYLTMKLPNDFTSIINAGIWITSGFLTLCGGVKLGRSGIETWKDIKAETCNTVTEESTTRSEVKQK